MWWETDMARHRKLISVRKPRLRFTPDGIKMTKPSYRIGGRSGGVNISSRGVSYSTRTPLGTYNSRRGCSMPLGCMLSLLTMVLLFASTALAHVLMRND